MIINSRPTFKKKSELKPGEIYRELQSPAELFLFTERFNQIDWKLPIQGSGAFCPFKNGLDDHGIDILLETDIYLEVNSAPTAFNHDALPPAGHLLALKNSKDEECYAVVVSHMNKEKMVVSLEDGAFISPNHTWIGVVYPSWSLNRRKVHSPRDIDKLMTFSPKAVTAQ